MNSGEVTSWLNATTDSPANRYWYRNQRPYEYEFSVNAVTYQNSDYSFRYSTWGTTNQNYLITLKYKELSNEAFREIQNCVLLAHGPMRSFMLDLTTFSNQGSGFTNFNSDVDFTCGGSYSSNDTIWDPIVLSTTSRTGTLKKGDVLLSTELFGYGIVNFVSQDVSINDLDVPYSVPLSRAFKPLPDSSPAANQSTPYTVTLARYIPVSLVDNSFQATRSVHLRWNCEVQFVVRDTRL
jgi:hypothetical protein